VGLIGALESIKLLLVDSSNVNVPTILKKISRLQDIYMAM
jgi:hypothetical protein